MSDVMTELAMEANDKAMEIARLRADNDRLRELCADVWHLFTEHGAVNPCDLPVVDAVRDRMRELEVCVMESSTKILRRMLDERGVEWEAYDDFEPTTWWSTHNGAFAYWARERDGKLLVETTAPTKCSASCTPEQAIAATLGTGTCEADETDHIECSETVGGRHYDIHIMECTECGHTYEHVNGDYEFCPRCGRKRRDVEQ